MLEAVKGCFSHKTSNKIDSGEVNIMRKCVVSLAVGLLSVVSLSAAIQFNFFDPFADLEGSIHGSNGVYFTFDSDTTVMIDDPSNHFKGMEFGWYDLSDPTVLNPSVTATNILGNFETDSMIGLWITAIDKDTKQAVTITSTNTGISDYVFGRFVTLDVIDDNRFYLGGRDLNGGEIYSVGHISSTPWNRPVGEPLPGVLAALAACGCVAVLKFRKK